jgi:hypothetical protein
VARGRVCNFIVVVFTRFGRLGRRFGVVVRAVSDFGCGWCRYGVVGGWLSVVCVSVLCFIPKCLHTFLSATMVSQCLCRCFCFCRLCVFVVVANVALMVMVLAVIDGERI